MLTNTTPPEPTATVESPAVPLTEMVTSLGGESPDFPAPAAPYISAAYSPADDKLRLRSYRRLSAADYQRVKAAGFAWAPKQDCFYAVWTPEREDLALDLAGDIEAEETTRTGRASDRAERFRGYYGRRAADAERARQAVSALADGIPLGQPILVGHHSQRRAERDARRIENGMRKTVDLWRTSEYWRDRAAASLAHAERMERPEVRARRVKKLEADERRHRRERAKSGTFLALWEKLFEGAQPDTWRVRAERVANVDILWNLWSDLRYGKITPEAARERAVAAHRRNIARCDRWLVHLGNRLTYDRALLTESGYAPPPPKKSAKASLPLLNLAGKVAWRNRYTGETVETEAEGITKAEYAKLHADYKGTVVSACGTHRLRVAMLRRPGGPVCGDGIQPEGGSAGGLGAPALPDSARAGGADDRG